MPSIRENLFGGSWMRIEQRVMYAVGLLLTLSGFVHVLVWISEGGNVASLSGDVSWRKPILFGFSAGATMLSLAWFVGKTSRRQLDGLLLSIFGLAMAIEVALITLQAWRGVASHFNQATPFDANVLIGIEGLILFATLVIGELTRRSFGPMQNTQRDMRVAIRGGMALLLFACLLGFVLVGYGNHRQASGLDPGVYGSAGVMKFPHGMPIHAIQYLPIAAWVLGRLGADESRRLLGVSCTLASVVAFTVFSLLQTFSGRARFDVDGMSATILGLSIALLVIPVVVGMTSWRSAPMDGQAA